MKDIALALLLAAFLSPWSRAAVAPPPTRGSLADQNDLEAILEVQAARSDEDCTRAAFEADEDLSNMFGPPYGPLNPEEVASLTADFDQISDQVEPIVHAEKIKWARLRPYLEDPRIHPCVRLEKSFSYPSGHAANSWVYAQTLARIYPERPATVFESRAVQVGEDRVLGGMHHPSDIAAGRELGAEIFESWLKDPEFQARLKTLRSHAHSCGL